MGSGTADTAPAHPILPLPTRYCPCPPIPSRTPILSRFFFSKNTTFLSTVLDFSCGPGSLVIRISGFEDDNDACVGQIIEPQTDGQVNVAWSNGMTSLCHPQDLFLCGEGELNSLFGEDTGKWLANTRSGPAVAPLFEKSALCVMRAGWL